MDLDVLAGHIYESGSTVSGSSVTITITDVTNRELGKNLNIGSASVYKRTVTLREEKPKEENITVTIENYTGYPVYFMYISPSNSDSWGHDVLGSNEVLNNKRSRKVTLPPLNTSRRYDIKLEDKDGDTYTKWDVTIT